MCLRTNLSRIKVLTQIDARRTRIVCSNLELIGVCPDHFNILAFALFHRSFFGIGLSKYSVHIRRIIETSVYILSSKLRFTIKYVKVELSYAPNVSL